MRAACVRLGPRLRPDGGLNERQHLSRACAGDVITRTKAAGSHGEDAGSVNLAFLFGERGRNRTYNLLIKSQLLCQLSYAPWCDEKRKLPGKYIQINTSCDV